MGADNGSSRWVQITGADDGSSRLEETVGADDGSRRCEQMCLPIIFPQHADVTSCCAPEAARLKTPTRFISKQHDPRSASLGNSAHRPGPGDGIDTIIAKRSALKRSQSAPSSLFLLAKRRDHVTALYGAVSHDDSRMSVT